MKFQPDLKFAPVMLTVVLAFGAPSTLAETVAAHEVEVVATEFGFEPSEIQVAPGSQVRVTLINNGVLSHNLHIAGKPVKSETLQNGQKDTIMVEAPTSGKLEFFCNVPGHKEAGMKGNIVVE